MQCPGRSWPQSAPRCTTVGRADHAARHRITSNGGKEQGQRRSAPITAPHRSSQSRRCRPYECCPKNQTTATAS
eukprot:1424619-Alexandrium_andersonii.AAC.1